MEDKLLFLRPWLTPLLYALKNAGGCMARGDVLARMRKKSFKSLVWFARGLVEARGDKICLTSMGARVAKKLELVGSRGVWTLYRFGEKLLILVNIKPTRVTAYIVPPHLVEKALRENLVAKEEIQRRLSLHPKTASIIARTVTIIREARVNIYKPGKS